MYAKPLQEYLDLYRYQATDSPFEESPRGGTYFSIEKPAEFYRGSYIAGGGQNLIHRLVNRNLAVKSVNDPIPGRGYLQASLQDRSAKRYGEIGTNVRRMEHNLRGGQKNLIRYAKAFGISSTNRSKFLDYISALPDRSEQAVAISDWLGIGMAKSHGVKAILGSKANLGGKEMSSSLLVLDSSILEPHVPSSPKPPALGDLRLNPMDGFSKKGVGSFLRGLIAKIHSPSAIKVIAMAQEQAGRYMSVYRYQTSPTGFEMSPRGGSYFSMAHTPEYKTSEADPVMGGPNLIKRMVDRRTLNAAHSGSEGASVGADFLESEYPVEAERIRKNVLQNQGKSYVLNQKNMRRYFKTFGISSEDTEAFMDKFGHRGGEGALAFRERMGAELAKSQGYDAIYNSNTYFALNDRPFAKTANEKYAGMTRLGSQTFDTKELANEVKPFGWKKAGIVAGVVSAGVGLTSLIMAKHTAYNMANQDDRRRNHPYRSTRSIQSAGVFG